MYVNYRKTCYDILVEFDLYEEQTAKGLWVCSACRDWPNPNKTDPLVEYEDREELWIKHSFEPMAAWTRKSFTPSAKLCLCSDHGATWAVLAQDPLFKVTEKHLEFFKEFPVLTARNGKR